jgi:hypothetical protein
VAFSQKRALKEGRTIVFCDQSGFYLLPMVVRTYAPVGKTPLLKENLTRDHLSAMSGITLEGKLYMIEQERAFKGEDVVRFLKHLMRQIPSKLLISYGTDLRSTGEGRSRTFWRAERLVAGCNWSRFLATHQISTQRRGSGSTSSAWS